MKWHSNLKIADDLLSLKFRRFSIKTEEACRFDDWIDQVVIYIYIYEWIFKHVVFDDSSMLKLQKSILAVWACLN